MASGSMSTSIAHCPVNFLSPHFLVRFDRTENGRTRKGFKGNLFALGAALLGVRGALRWWLELCAVPKRKPTGASSSLL